MQAEFLGKSYEVKIWTPEIVLGRHIALDTETTWVEFTETPDLVTFQAFDGNSVFLVRMRDVSSFFEINCDSTFIFHNAPFDVDVICKHLEDNHYFHEMLDEDRVRDTAIMYRLLHLATVGWTPHTYSLKVLAAKYFNYDMSKEARENFTEYLGKEYEDMADSDLTYAALDVIVTYHLYHRLASQITATGSTTVLSHQIQLAGAIALNRIYKRGIGFDLEKAQVKLEELNSAMKREAALLSTYGWVRGQKGINERYERIVRDFLHLELPLTDDGSISSKSDDLAPYRHEPFVDAYLKYHDLEKSKSFIDKLESKRVHPRYNYIVNTGRTSCSSPNFQQLPKEGGIRELFRARDGYTFIITDYSAIELATLAQTIYSRDKESVMRSMINDGVDLHRYYASVLHNIPPEEVTKQQRQEAKAANFGFPGGLGIETFIAFSRGYGLELSELKAQQMKDAWFAAFPEMKGYMQYKEPEEAGWTLTGRKRARASYCARKNFPFQGLASDGAKLAMYYLDHAGIDVVGFVHDEIVSEVPICDADKLLTQQEEIMRNAMKIVVPDVLVGVESMISEVYTK
jgi:DNA polymerase-1